MIIFSSVQKYFFVLASAALFMASSAAYSQKYSFEPAKSASAEWKGESELSLHVYVKNTSTEAINLSWKKLTTEIAAGWGAQFCDNNFCYFPIPDERDFSPIEPGTTADMKFIVYPSGLLDPLTVKFVVGETGGEFKDTVTFAITFPTDVEENSDRKISFSPNPAEDFLMAQLSFDAVSASIYNVMGERIYEIAVSGNAPVLDTKHLSAGTYLAVFSNANGKIYSRQFQKN